MPISISPDFIRRDPQFFKGGTSFNFKSKTFLEKYRSFPSGFLDSIFNDPTSPSVLINGFPKDGILSGRKLGFYFIEALESDDFASYWGNPDYSTQAFFVADFVRVDDLVKIQSGLILANTIRTIPRGFPLYALTDVYTVAAVQSLFLTGPRGGGPTDAVLYFPPGYTPPVYNSATSDLQTVLADTTHRYVVMFAIEADVGPLTSAFRVIGDNPTVAGWVIYGADLPSKRMTIYGLSKVSPSAKIPVDTTGF